MAAGFLKSAFRSHGHHHRTGADVDTRPPSLPPFPYPFEPIARSKVYFIVAPTGSGPLITAVAISGYCMARTPLTSSIVIWGFGSGSLSPAKENSRRMGVDFIALLRCCCCCRLTELLRIHA